MVAPTTMNFTEQESGALLGILAKGAPATCPRCKKQGVDKVDSMSRLLFGEQQSAFPGLRWAVLECAFCGATGRHPE